MTAKFHIIAGSPLYESSCYLDSCEGFFIYKKGVLLMPKDGKVKDENYVLIQGWMIGQLGLKGNELIVYAIIYGFTQAENQVFSGSLQYLADWTNSTKQSVIKCLKSLIEKGLIGKDDEYINGVKFCKYYATKFNGVVNKVEHGIKQSLTGGIKQSLPNNIDSDNTRNNKNNIVGKRFQPPTLSEVRAYCQERQNNVDAERFIDYYTSNGWKVGKNPMKDWKAAVRTWERQGWNGYGYSGQKQQPQQPKRVADENESINHTKSFIESLDIFE